MISQSNALPASPDSIAQDIFCQDCGYNLRGLTGDRCPECGRSLEGLRSTVSKIPWVHRKEIGRFRAYWKTVWFVMFRQRQFCDEMARDHRYGDSQKFRWTTIAFACLPIIAAAILGSILDARSPTDHELFNMYWSNLGLAISVHVGFILFLAAATGAPSYFFESKVIEIPLRNRAIALSYYACGALSFLFLPAIAVVVWLNLGLDDKIGMFFMLCAANFAAKCAPAYRSSP